MKAGVVLFQLVLCIAIFEFQQTECSAISKGIEPLSLELASSKADDDLETLLSDGLEVHLRSRRSLDDDACHQLSYTDLPNSKEAIHSAWTNSTSFLLKVSTAVDNIKQCPSWNIIKSVTCFIKGVLEVRSSYVTYKPQIYALINQIGDSLTDLKTNFVGCSKLLLINQS
ncbi:Hypothetical protein NTJ_11817 [Nesidiocoris tenuis]|uniref:Uncharacterized protein n=1 Tax=Nesidiocoris tenuis TaxID=355587 RepID=A0ABN7B780_9HEMI|nr:Hypothetical protein NTJ_11817 [Nesidiocoris tenuis]